MLFDWEILVKIVLSVRTASSCCVDLTDCPYGFYVNPYVAISCFIGRLLAVVSQFASTGQKLTIANTLYSFLQHVIQTPEFYMSASYD